MKITKRQLKRIIQEERARLVKNLNESIPNKRLKDYERTKQRPLNDLMKSINSLIVYIEGQLMSPGGYDYEDVFDWDFGHIARLADLIDAAREKAAEEGVPFREPDTSEIAQYQHRGKPAVVSRWSMNESVKRGKRRKLTEMRGGKLPMGDRALSMYANLPVMNQAKSSLEKLYLGIVDDAIDDGAEEAEAEDMAGEALLELVRGILSNMGHQYVVVDLKGSP